MELASENRLPPRRFARRDDRLPAPDDPRFCLPSLELLPNSIRSTWNLIPAELPSGVRLDNDQYRRRRLWPDHRNRVGQGDRYR